MAKTVKKKLSDLIPDNKNFNKGSEFGNSLIEKSFRKFGAGRSILIDKNDRIIAGNKSVENFGAIGGENVLIVETDKDTIVAVKRNDIDLDTPEGREMALADNATAKANIVWDAEVIEATIEEAVCEEWGVELSKEEPEAKEDDFEGTAPKEQITVLGDLYEIGEHRLLFGDSTASDQVAKLMNGQKADISIQSPPYNVGKTPNGDEKKYANDSDNKSNREYLELLNETTKNALLNSVFSFINIQSVAGNKITLIEFISLFKDFFCDYIIWDKMQAEPAMGENILNSKFEFVYIFGENAKRRIGVKKFRGNLENIIYIKSRQDKEFASIHKATYPVAFPAYFIENFSMQSCLDLFIGTGTTMVASQQLNRKCYGMELDPKYCDVIVARMIKLDSSLTIKRNGQQLDDKEKQRYIDNTNAN